MFENQTTVTITKDELIPKVQNLKVEGFRLVQICCTKLEQLEMNYSFDKDYQFTNLRIELPMDNPELPSISGIYWNAFLYENEVHDLFKIRVTGMVIDYDGNLYRTKVKWPFRECEKGGADG